MGGLRAHTEPQQLRGVLDSLLGVLTLQNIKAVVSDCEIEPENVVLVTHERAEDQLR